jgi:hypothetical protein
MSQGYDASGRRVNPGFSAIGASEQEHLAKVRTEDAMRLRSEPLFDDTIIEPVRELYAQFKMIVEAHITDATDARDAVGTDEGYTLCTAILGALTGLYEELFSTTYEVRGEFVEDVLDDSDSVIDDTVTPGLTADEQEELNRAWQALQDKIGGDSGNTLEVKTVNHINDIAAEKFADIPDPDAKYHLYMEGEFVKALTSHREAIQYIEDNELNPEDADIRFVDTDVIEEPEDNEPKMSEGREVGDAIEGKMDGVKRTAELGAPAKRGRPGKKDK